MKTCQNGFLSNLYKSYVSFLAWHKKKKVFILLTDLPLKRYGLSLEKYEFRNHLRVRLGLDAKKTMAAIVGKICSYTRRAAAPAQSIIFSLN